MCFIVEFCLDVFKGERVVWLKVNCCEVLKYVCLKYYIFVNVCFCSWVCVFESLLNLVGIFNELEFFFKF